MELLCLNKNADTHLNQYELMRIYFKLIYLLTPWPLSNPYFQEGRLVVKEVTLLGSDDSVTIVTKFDVYHNLSLQQQLLGLFIFVF